MQVWRTLVAYARSAARGRRVVWLYALSGIAMLSVGLLASYLPARKASNVDPIESLRGE